MIIKGTVIVRISRSRKDNEIFLNGCAQGGSALLQISNGTSAVFRRGATQKRVTILAVPGEDCPGEQVNNFLEVSPATARMFRLTNGFLYALEFNQKTNVLTISLRRTQTTAPFGIEEVNVQRNDVFLVTGGTHDALNLPGDNTVLTVIRAGKVRKLKSQTFAEGEAEFGDGFETSAQTAAFFGFITGNRYVLRFNQVTLVLEIHSVGGK
ncbi:hypothetical protein [Paenibacillus spongiae]|uniref:IgGFc-binding protein N-terminal domain-containing protein n=1 Tax=Paenibacillus spongiae TaxID=2909671 RepID=A0ABY5S4D4_9BACL|nr:hypothetical protein [Paenibacillus spongiae]UVI27732.1 hypothetical protein L1F29_19940 [Paenibacillus spongiae]